MLVFALGRSSASGNAFLFTVNVSIGFIPLKYLSENKSVPDFPENKSVPDFPDFPDFRPGFPWSRISVGCVTRNSGMRMIHRVPAKGANEVMESENEFTKYGTFDISPDKQVFGELCVAGPDSYLYLRDEAFFHTTSLPDGCITGTIHDLTKVTLTNSCLRPPT